ncbi:hypothetical protein ABFU82_12825 [Nocardioides sp. WV_118_6]
MATDEGRSARGRELAEEALVRLAVRLDSHRDELVVIGGLNPEFLTSDPPVPHQGTNDVDILLSVGFVYDRDELDFGWLEKALRDAGFTIDEQTKVGWRWRLELHGATIKLELLWDVQGEDIHPIVLPGCAETSAMNLLGPGAAMNDTQLRVLVVPEELGGGEVALRFAGLGGYLMSKAAAIVGRGHDKDYYDFAYVLLYNTAGGPARAAQVLADAGSRDLLERYRTDLHEAVRLFTTGERPGAGVFAREMQESGVETELEILVEDAASAADEFWRTLQG